MHDTKSFRWWMVGGAVIVLALGVAIPHVAPNPLAGGANAPTSSATVPAQLLAAEQSPSAPLAEPSPAATDIAVYVCGDVHRPGVYTFTPGQRVADGIARAGGALADADLEQINLAQPLADAMKIDVPKKGQIVAISAVTSTSFDAGSSHRRSARRGGRSSHKLQPGQTLDVNTASESDLTSLPGVGPSLARRIAEYRTANGPFQTVDDLQNVSGIGPSKFDKMAPYIRL
jgi:competence protein ComEA